MFFATIAGNLGKDAEHRTTQGGVDICNFAVAADVGWGDKKRTIWVDCAKFGKGAQSLAGYLKKGSKVTVIGEITTREHEGKTYINCNVTDLKMQDAKGGGQSGGYGEAKKPYDSGQQSGGYDDLDDDIPF